MHKEQLILRSAQEYNILPLTSNCDAECVFCSHKYNRKEVRVVRIFPRGPSEVEGTLEFLDGRKKIIIGESATIIIEGEPLSHPQFGEVIRLVRKRFPRTIISLTTNGYRIEQNIHILKEAAPLEINLSLNSTTIRGRSIIMGDDQYRAEQAVKSVALLSAAGIPFHGSIVAMPHLIGWKDMEETVVFLALYGALTIRVFMAGYAQNAHPRLMFNREKMHRDLADFIADIGKKVPCPLLLEPPKLTNLKPVVAGVIKEAKADKAGMKKGDIIVSVNGRKPRSRVEAWQYAREKGTITMETIRQGELKEIIWENKNRDEGSGLVMEYDFDMKRMDRIEGIVSRHSGQVLMLCSELGEGVLRAAWESKERQEGLIHIHPTKNYFFGGSVGAAGLLTIDDFFQAFLKYRDLNKNIPDLIMLPGEAFDYTGRDLTGQPLEELSRRTGVKVKTG